jgi:hypothetical protein
MIFTEDATLHHYFDDLEMTLSTKLDEIKNQFCEVIATALTLSKQV